MKISKFKLSTTTLLFFLSILAGALLLYRKIGVRPKAAPGVPTLSFAVEPAGIPAGQNFDLILKVNPNNATFYAFELYFAYDPTKLEFQNTTSLAQNITSSFLLAKTDVNSSTFTVVVIGTRTGSAFSGSADTEIARVKMKTKAGASGDVVFTWVGNTKLGSNIPIEMVNGAFTIGGGAITGAVLSLDAPGLVNSTAQRGQNVDVQVLLNTNGKQVKSTDIVIPYDDSKLTFQNTVDLSQNIEIDPTSGFDTQLALKTVNPTARTITIALQTQTPFQSSSDVLLATIKFVVRVDAADGLVEILPDQSRSTVYDLQTQNILECVGGYRLLVGQSTTLSPTPTTFTRFPTDTPFPTGPTYVQATLNLKIKLQGVVGRPNTSNTIPVKVTLQSDQWNFVQSKSVNFSVDNNGIWFGSSTFTLPKSYDYKVYIKGPKHLQKRICRKGPQEPLPGTYQCEFGEISLLTSGTYTLDFSGIYQLAGDLPPQDGLVNSYDISLVRNNIGLGKNTSPQALASADLNFDGIVDSQDYSLVIAALAIRTDDEL